LWQQVSLGESEALSAASLADHQPFYIFRLKSCALDNSLLRRTSDRSLIDLPTLFVAAVETSSINFVHGAATADTVQVPPPASRQ